jgi:glycosyltransferase involved in cell wall biosynthesis
MTGRSIAVLCVTAQSDRPEAETFIGLKNEGVALHVMCSPRARYYGLLRDAGVTVTPLEIECRLDFAAIERIRAELHGRRYDVIHLFNNKAVFHGLMAARGTGARVVAYRGIVGNVSFLNPFCWFRYLNPRVDRIVCVAEAVRRYLLDLRFLGLRVAPRKVVTIYKGHDLAWYQDSPADLAQIGIPAGAFVVVCVANWRPRKGIEVLLEAFGKLPPEAPIYLLLVGDMVAPNLRRAIESHTYRERIHALGVRQDAPAVAAACNVAVLPALKREGLPKSVIEAMAYGVPTIVTDVGGSPELVEHEVSGLVVRPGDPAALAQAILRLYREPEQARELGRRGRDRIRVHFPISATVERTAALYREIALDRNCGDGGGGGTSTRTG